jgi:hypothetical protein
VIYSLKPTQQLFSYIDFFFVAVNSTRTDTTSLSDLKNDSSPKVKEVLSESQIELSED